MSDIEQVLAGWGAAAQGTSASALRPRLEAAARIGARAAALGGKRVSVDVVAEQSKAEISFSGPGADIARRATLVVLRREVPGLTEDLRKQLISSLEGR